MAPALRNWNLMINLESSSVLSGNAADLTLIVVSLKDGES